MPEYKKKRVKKSKKNTKNTYTDVITMEPKAKKEEPKPKKTANKQEESEPNTAETKKVRIIRGNKLRNKRRRQIILGAVALIIVGFVIFSLCLPTGIIEFFQNTFAAAGSGSGYPTAITGGSLIDTTQMGDVFITITPTQISGFNNKSGKEVFSYQHGYERPLVATSEARFMIYSQGETEYSVYNFEKKLLSGETENDILAATITRNGMFAVATQSDGYSSEVTVFNKKGKDVYTWYCADYIITDLELSNNGKKLVVSAINAQKGTYVSKLIVLDFDTATPIYSKVFEDEILLNLNSENSKTFCAVFENKVEFFEWSSFENTVFETEKSFIFSRTTSSNTLLVAGHKSNKSNNTVYIFNKKGEKTSQFDVNFEILDISFKGDYIYILSDKIIYLYSEDGERIASGECSFGVVRVLPISHHNAIALTDNTANKIDIE